MLYISGSDAVVVCCREFTISAQQNIIGLELQGQFVVHSGIDSVKCLNMFHGGHRIGIICVVTLQHVQVPHGWSPCLKFEREHEERDITRARKKWEAEIVCSKRRRQAQSEGKLPRLVPFAEMHIRGSMFSETDGEELEEGRAQTIFFCKSAEVVQGYAPARSKCIC